jgi:hypothetical protein
MDPRTTGSFEASQKEGICQNFPNSNFMYCCNMCYGLLFELGG